jgi:hypothetical protein
MVSTVDLEGSDSMSFGALVYYFRRRRITSAARPSVAVKVVDGSGTLAIEMVFVPPVVAVQSNKGPASRLVPNADAMVSLLKVIEEIGVIVPLSGAPTGKTRLSPVKPNLEPDPTSGVAAEKGCTGEGATATRVPEKNLREELEEASEPDTTTVPDPAS